MLKRVFKATALVGVGYLVGQLAYAYHQLNNPDEWIVRLRQFRDKRDRREQLNQLDSSTTTDIDIDKLFDGTSSLDVEELYEGEDDTDFDITDD